MTTNNSRCGDYLYSAYLLLRSIVRMWDRRTDFGASNRPTIAIPRQPSWESS